MASDYSRFRLHAFYFRKVGCRWYICTCFGKLALLYPRAAQGLYQHEPRRVFHLYGTVHIVVRSIWPHRSLDAPILIRGLEPQPARNVLSSLNLEDCSLRWINALLSASPAANFSTFFEFSKLLNFRGASPLLLPHLSKARLKFHCNSANTYIPFALLRRFTNNKTAWIAETSFPSIAPHSRFISNEMAGGKKPVKPRNTPCPQCRASKIKVRFISIQHEEYSAYFILIQVPVGTRHRWGHWM